MVSKTSKYMSLSESDVLIFCGGAGDVGKINSTKVVQHNLDFIKTNNHTNIILVILPPRYDFMKSSCVNSEIKTFIRNPKKMAKVYQHSALLKMVNYRKPFTNHGLHLNCQGKDVLSKLTVS